MKYEVPEVGRLVGKAPDAGKGRRQKEKGAAEDKMVRQHHQFNGYEFEQTPGDSGGPIAAALSN